MSGWTVVEQMRPELEETEMLPRLSEPRKYQVVLLNDDYTPMDFVVTVLQAFFYLSEEAATQVMLQVHHQGRAVCGVYTRDIAETKVVLVNEFSKTHQHPLLCCMEPVHD